MKNLGKSRTDAIEMGVPVLLSPGLYRGPFNTRHTVVVDRYHHYDHDCTPPNKLDKPGVIDVHIFPYYYYS